MNKKVNKSIISLAIASILVGGAMLMPASAYADNSNNNSSNSSNNNSDSTQSTSSNSDSEHSTSSNSSSDDNYRGTASDSQTITICHVPKGNPGNKHTIHIGFSAWPAHRDNHGGDYLGSCNNPPSSSSSPSTPTVDNFVVIKDCTGNYRNTLSSLTQSYFDPLIVNDDTRSDGGMTTALSKCLDRGDSSDSSKTGNDKGTKSNGQGGGHDSISDSGHHHRISSCKNSDSKGSDSSKNFRKDLDDKNKIYNTAPSHSHGDSSINVSVKSLDDSAVKREYKKCTDSTSTNHKGKIEKGDSGHKYLELTKCSNAKDIKAAIESYKAKVVIETKPIILNTSSLADASIKAAVDACLNPSQGAGTTSTVASTGHAGRLNWREITNK